MIKLLYFGKSEMDEISEYYYIKDEILNEFEIETCEFILSLEELKIRNQTFDVLVYSCGDPNKYPSVYIPTYQDIFKCVTITKPKIIIQLSDEFDFENLQEHNQLGRYCELFLLQHHLSNYEYTSNTVQIPSINKVGNKVKEALVTNIIKNKLNNFPPINFVSIEESEDRRRVLYNSFEKYKLKNITPHIYKRYNDMDHQISGRNSDFLIPKRDRGPVTSHLKAIKEWYETTNEDYAFFCEDDLSFESVQYWNFTWEEFFNKLPKNWECVQLCFTSTSDWYTDNILYDINQIFRYRDWCDWSCCAYLIKRSQAKSIVDNYFNGDEIILEYKGVDYDRREKMDESWLIPTPETMTYTYFLEGTIYFIPLFLESLQFKSSWVSDDEGQRHSHTYSTISVLNWWKTTGKNLKLNTIIT